MTEQQVRAALTAGDEDQGEKLNRLYAERRRDKCGGMRCTEGPCSCWQWAKQRALQ